MTLISNSFAYFPYFSQKLQGNLHQRTCVVVIFVGFHQVFVIAIVETCVHSRKLAHVKKLLFVCLGNICRSPAAHAITSHLIERFQLVDRVFVDSAGTANYQVGKPADPRMRVAAMARGYLLGTQAKQLTAPMVHHHDLVIAMDRNNFRDILQISREEPRHVALLSEFLPPAWPRDVPDPYLGNQDGFEFVLDMLEQACPAILEKITGLPLRMPDPPPDLCNPPN